MRALLPLLLLLLASVLCVSAADAQKREWNALTDENFDDGLESAAHTVVLLDDDSTQRLEWLSVLPERNYDYEVAFARVSCGSASGLCNELRKLAGADDKAPLVLFARDTVQAVAYASSLPLTQPAVELWLTEGHKAQLAAALDSPANNAAGGAEEGDFDWAALKDPDTLVLTDDSFDTTLQTSQRLLLDIYAPWCPHCQTLAPIYAQAATKVKASGKPGIVVAKLDGDAHGNTPARFRVEGFPTLLLLVPGQNKYYEFSGSGSTPEVLEQVATGAPGWESHVTEKGAIPAKGEYASQQPQQGEEGEEGEEEPEQPVPGGSVAALDDKTFDETLSKKGGVWIVDFYATWCPHCQQLEPRFLSASALAPSANFAKVDTDNSPKLTERFNIEGLPTLLLIKDGSYWEYNGGRTSAAIAEFAKLSAGWEANAQARGKVPAPPKAKKPAASSSSTKATETPKKEDADEAVVTLTDANYDSLTKNKIFFIAATAEWCGHCKRLKPEFAAAAKLARQEGLRVTFAVFDAEKNSALASKFDVNSYPTLIQVQEDGSFTKPAVDRDSSSLSNHARMLHGGAAKSRATWATLKDPNTISVTEKVYGTRYKRGQKWIIEFFASWCGHCEEFAPLWAEFATIMKARHPEVVVGKVDTDRFRSLAGLLNVTELPTIIVIEESGAMKNYKGTRDVKSLLDLAEGRPVYHLLEHGTAPIPDAEENHFPSDLTLLHDDDARHVLTGTKAGKWIIYVYTTLCPQCSTLRSEFLEIHGLANARKDKVVHAAALNSQESPLTRLTFKIVKPPPVLLFVDAKAGRAWRLPSETFSADELLSMSEEGLPQNESQAFDWAAFDVIENAEKEKQTRSGEEEDEFAGTGGGKEKLVGGEDEEEAQRKRRAEQQKQAQKKDERAYPVVVINEDHLDSTVATHAQPWAVLFYDKEDSEWESLWRATWRRASKQLPKYRFALVSTIDEPDLAERLGIEQAFQVVVFRKKQMWISSPDVFSRSQDAEATQLAVENFVRSTERGNGDEVPGKEERRKKRKTTHDGPSAIEELTGVNYAARTKQGVWLVVFYGPQCVSCKKLFEEVLEQLAQTVSTDRHHQLQGHHIGRINVDDELNYEVARAEKIDYMPTIKVVAQGHSYVFTGDNTAEALRRFLDVGWREREAQLRPRARHQAPVERDEAAEKLGEQELREERRRAERQRREGKVSPRQRFDWIVQSLKDNAVAVVLVGVLTLALLFLAQMYAKQARELQRVRGGGKDKKDKKKEHKQHNNNNNNNNNNNSGGEGKKHQQQPQKKPAELVQHLKKSQ